MKPKAYIFAGLAIVCGLGASYMTSRLLAERTVEEPERVEILVAKRQINVGERIVKPDDMFEMKAVLKENEPPDAIKDFDTVKGKTMKSGRNRGDHIVPGNLYDKDPIDIPEGHQAVGLPVNLATTAHGLASLPGSRVNLILTARNNDPGRSTSRVLLRNVLVLAADGRTNREGEPIAPAQVVTFALHEKDALKVSLAKELGVLSLTLRKLNATEVASEDEEDNIVSGDQIFGIKKFNKKETAPPPPVVAQETPNPKVEPKVEQKDIRSFSILNGPQKTTVQYQVGPNGEISEVDGGEVQAPPPPPSPQPQRPQPQPQPKGGGNGQQREF